jgi:hypothetical protein
VRAIASIVLFVVEVMIGWGMLYGMAGLVIARFGLSFWIVAPVFTALALWWVWLSHWLANAMLGK